VENGRSVLYPTDMLPLVLAIALGAAPSSPYWTQLRAHKCPRCQSIHERRLTSNNVRIPENAIIYFFAGEFAKDPKLWVLDLDTGAMTQCASDNQAACTSAGEIGADALRNLRRSALKVWERDWPRKGMVHIAPGVMTDCYVVSGNRMATFDPLDGGDEVLTKEIEQAIRLTRR
jgi:hypothetical protein